MWLRIVYWFKSVGSGLIALISEEKLIDKQPDFSFEDYQ